LKEFERVEFIFHLVEFMVHIC